MFLKLFDIQISKYEISLLTFRNIKYIMFISEESISYINNLIEKNDISLNLIFNR